MTSATTARPSKADHDLDARTLIPSVAPAGRLRRRPLMILVAVGLIVLGGVAGLLVWMSSSTATEVVAVRASVARGEVVANEDLMVVRVSLDPSLQVVPAAQLSELVGKRAAADLSAGSLVGPSQVSDESVPVTGSSIVGVALSAGQLPAEPLRPGDRVRLVQTPAAQAYVPAVPLVIDAVVHSVSAVGADGQTVVVDVVVPASKAPEVAARAGTGRVAIVLDSRER